MRVAAYNVYRYSKIIRKFTASSLHAFAVMAIVMFPTCEQCCLEHFITMTYLIQSGLLDFESS